MSDVFAFGIGISQTDSQGNPLDCYFPTPCLNPSGEVAAAVASLPNGTSTAAPEEISYLIADHDLAPAVLLEADQPLQIVKLVEDVAIDSTPEAYLKLHLLSHRMTLPNTLNLDGIFPHLPNLAWTTQGAISTEELDQEILSARLKGEHLEIMSVDKFPKMVNYVMPSGVRIADASRIRLGAYLGDGTTVMHEGFVNFNAGALGPNMVEGRISQGVTIDAGTDLGGSASTMGTLSGGGEITITLGKNCLVGANAGTGIPLGDRCTIEAGLYITAGTVVTVVDETGTEVRKAKARELAGNSDMLFIRNSQNGQVLCRTNRRAIELNDALHAHN
ncbi:MAG: 2,3,4,5-tetrahydropyridine-2,6-dicarboxylate N-succinyltransferase [Pseudomonadales bacterium]|nr:2,3,4,5-tetrahydropyridine-2,6-dicarboxylate N-succinyltransferase [Pseudomonadales bacterium]